MAFRRSSVRSRSAPPETSRRRPPGGSFRFWRRRPESHLRCGRCRVSTTGLTCKGTTSVVSRDPYTVKRSVPEGQQSGTVRRSHVLMCHLRRDITASRLSSRHLNSRLTPPLTGVPSGDENMKAVVRERYGSPDVLELRDVAMPRPKGNEVLVRVHAASVNDWDWGLLQGRT